MESNPFDALALARSMADWRRSERVSFEHLLPLAEKVLAEVDGVIDPELRSSVTPQSVLLRFIVRFINDDPLDFRGGMTPEEFEECCETGRA
jgi:hypothetical protein